MNPNWREIIPYEEITFSGQQTLYAFEAGFIQFKDKYILGTRKSALQNRNDFTNGAPRNHQVMMVYTNISVVSIISDLDIDIFLIDGS